MSTRLVLPTPRDFALAPSICSYGYYQLAPNRWDPQQQILHRPLRDRDGRVIRCTISHDSTAQCCIVHCHRTVGREHHELILRQAARMLHLDSDPRIFRAFHKAYPPARQKKFGRIFRSPTLFEDMVKTITGCNTAWSNTRTMNRHLCEQIGSDGDFPTPAELARCTADEIKLRCRVGYRAQRIVRLARNCHEGRIDLAALQQPDLTAEALSQKLRAIHGFGPYAAHNVMQLLGHYDRMAIDSEVIAHLRRAHGYRGSAAQIARKAQHHYDAHAPFQFLVYWFELWFAHHDPTPGKPLTL